jgi:radical SAM-linked protein
VLHRAWKSGVKFDGWTEHFRDDLWTRAFEDEGIPKSAYLRAYDLEETLPWDILDVSIKKRWLGIELIKAKKEMRTEDCKWGHCYACGVPGNGADTVLARPMAGSLPALDVAAASPIPDPAAYREPAKGAAYRQKAMPDLPAASRRGAVPPESVRRHRLTFEKIGDARLLSHRNTMDVLERAIRAAGLPARYSEGFNPHMKLSMGPALPLGLESRHEVFELEAVAPLPEDAAGRISAKLPPGIRILDVRAVSPEEAPLSRAVRGARYAVRLEDPAQVSRAASALDGAAARVPALRALALEETAEGARLTFEVNLDQSAGETTTARKVLEALLELPPEQQVTLSVTREATVLA